MFATQSIKCALVVSACYALSSGDRWLVVTKRPINTALTGATYDIDGGQQPIS
jgi:hypothetical protein